MELWAYAWWLAVFILIVCVVGMIGSLIGDLVRLTTKAWRRRQSRRRYTGYRGPEDDLPF